MKYRKARDGDQRRVTARREGESCVWETVGWIDSKFFGKEMFAARNFETGQLIYRTTEEAADTFCRHANAAMPDTVTIPYEPEWRGGPVELPWHSAVATVA